MELIKPEVLAEATFQMRASSTMIRYVRVAQAFAEQSGLTNAMAAAGRVQEAIVHARALWSEAAQTVKRGPAEFELCVVLAALADATPRASASEALLQEIAANTTNQTSWAVHLARRLLWKHGPECRACGGSESAYIDMAGLGSSGPVWGQGPCYYCMAGDEAPEEAVEEARRLRAEVERGNYSYNDGTVCPHCGRPW
jgi:hypothetical protein